MIPKEVFEQTLREFFAPVVAFFDDPSVSEVMINGPDAIFIERAGKLYKTDARFSSVEALNAALRNAAQFAGKMVDTDRPILEGRLPDGSRIEAVMPPVGQDGPHVAIRRFFKQTLTVERLVELGALTSDASEALKALVEAKLNIIIAGGTGSGKTSMLNALSSFIPEDERVIVIEDSREVQLQREHVVQLEARGADARGKGAVTIRDLFKASLRMRPDRLVIGEIRGGEALDIIQAMTSGHGGCMGTLHATHPRDTLTRLETMCMMSDVEMPLLAMRMQIGSGVNLIVQVTRLRDGSRKISHITEVTGFDLDAQKYHTQDLFVREYSGQNQSGGIESRLNPTQVAPACLPQLKEHGVALPRCMFKPGFGQSSSKGRTP